jgi:3-phenylpropionate/trans-cinnamate dioxygenase ferredoxin subunit
MAEWIDIASVTEFPLSTHKVTQTNIGPIIIVNVDGDFYAVKDVCTHDGGTLSDGELINDELVCPRHGAHFCVKTGEALTPPAYEPVLTYPIRIQNGKVQIQLGD